MPTYAEKKDTPDQPEQDALIKVKNTCGTRYDSYSSFYECELDGGVVINLNTNQRTYLANLSLFNRRQCSYALENELNISRTYINLVPALPTKNYMRCVKAKEEALQRINEHIEDLKFKR